MVASRAAVLASQLNADRRRLLQTISVHGDPLAAKARTVGPRGLANVWLMAVLLSCAFTYVPSKHGQRVAGHPQGRSHSAESDHRWWHCSYESLHEDRPLLLNAKDIDAKNATGVRFLLTARHELVPTLGKSLLVNVTSVNQTPSYALNALNGRP